MAAFHRAAAVVAALIGLSGWAMAQGEYSGAIDAQSEVMRGIMQDWARSDAEALARWNSLPPRERYLRSSAIIAVSDFRDSTGRFPTDHDQDWLHQTLIGIGVESEAEARLVVSQMNDHMAAETEIGVIRDEACERARAWGYGEMFC